MGRPRETEKKKKKGKGHKGPGPEKGGEEREGGRGGPTSNLGGVSVNP